MGCHAKPCPCFALANAEFPFGKHREELEAIHVHACQRDARIARRTFLPTRSIRSLDLRCRRTGKNCALHKKQSGDSKIVFAPRKLALEQRVAANVAQTSSL